MNDELQHLKNLGKTSAQWLHAAGIHNASDLRRLGPWMPIERSKPAVFGPPKSSCMPSKERFWMSTGTNCRQPTKPS